jgi:hypothetical protein
VSPAVDQPGRLRVAFQRVPDFQPPQWPDSAHPQQFHLDLDVPDLDEAHTRVLELGATLLHADSRGWRVYADPAGHPLCLLQGRQELKQVLTVESHLGVVFREGLEPNGCTALIKVAWVLDRVRSEIGVGHGELRPVQLWLPGMHSYPVFEISQVGGRGVLARDSAAKGFKEHLLGRWITVGVLGQQPRRLGTVIAD